MEHHPICFRTSRSSVEEMGGPSHVAGKRLSETLDWRIREAINARKEKYLKNHRGKGVIVQSEVDVPEPPLPSPPLQKMFNPFELPDKYKTLNNLFAEMECSIRWLAMQNQLPTFQNICTQMERQTNKKFLISHLAQMKHVFPEAIVLETILAHHDKKTLCMKPEIKVTLLIKAKACSMFPAHSPSQSLWKAFHTKLLELSLTRPEGGEIPEAVLPYPFNRESYDARYNDSSVENPKIADVPDLVFWEKDISNHPPTKLQLQEQTVADARSAASEGLGSIENFSAEVKRKIPDVKQSGGEGPFPVKKQLI